MLNKITSELLEKLIDEIKKPSNITKIQSGIIDPLICYTYGKLYPYIIFCSIIFILTLLIAIIILLISLKLYVSNGNISKL